MSNATLEMIGAWFKGLIAACIGGAASAVTPAFVAPETFNFGDGLHKLGMVAAGGAIISGVFYLKGSPLPGVKGS